MVKYVLPQKTWWSTIKRITKDMPSKQQRAFSIVELLLVLVVISAILLGSLNLYQRFKFERDVDIIKENVEQLGQALNMYYYRHCHELEPTQTLQQIVPIAQLQREGFLPVQGLINLPWVSFSLYIRTEYSWKNIYQLWVVARINQPPHIVDYIRGATEAVIDPKIGNALGWMRLPSQRTATTDTSYWILNSSMQQFGKLTRDPAKKLTVCPY